MKPEKEYSNMSLVRELLIAVRPYKGCFAVASVLRISAEIAFLYPAYALAAITTFFTGYTPGQPLDGFWNIMILLGVANVFYFVASYYANFWGYRTAKRVSVDLELRAMRHAFSLDMDWHEKENTGNRVKRIARGSESVNVLLRMWFATFIEVTVGIVGVVFILAKFDGPIAAATVGFLVVYFFISFFFTRRAVKVQKLEHVKEEELSGTVFESISNVRSAKVMSMVQPLMNRLSKVCGEYYDLAEKRIYWYQSGGAAV